MGMWTPASVAASSTSVPRGTLSARPSMVTATRPSSGAAAVSVFGLSSAIYATAIAACLRLTGHPPAPQCSSNSPRNAW